MITAIFGLENLSYAFNSSQQGLRSVIATIRGTMSIKKPGSIGRFRVSRTITVAPGNGPIADERECTINMALEGT